MTFVETFPAERLSPGDGHQARGRP